MSLYRLCFNQGTHYKIMGLILGLVLPLWQSWGKFRSSDGSTDSLVRLSCDVRCVKSEPFCSEERHRCSLTPALECRVLFWSCCPPHITGTKLLNLWFFCRRVFWKSLHVDQGLALVGNVCFILIFMLCLTLQFKCSYFWLYTFHFSFCSLFQAPTQNFFVPSPEPTWFPCWMNQASLYLLLQKFYFCLHLFDA